MDFPSVRVADRSFLPPKYPVSSYKSMNGTEVRILRGSKPSGAELELTYTNILDIEAEKFTQHYLERLGEFHSFLLPAGSPARTAGWKGATNWMQIEANGNRWRYAEQPVVTPSRFPGRSNVRVRLVSVL